MVKSEQKRKAAATVTNIAFDHICMKCFEAAIVKSEKSLSGGKRHSQRQTAISKRNPKMHEILCEEGRVASSMDKTKEVRSLFAGRLPR